MEKVKVLIPTGFGENCSAEVSAAYSLAGAEVSIVHINDIISGNVNIHDFQILNWAGGFLDGDDLGSARAGACRLKNARVGMKTLMDEILDFKNQGKLIGGQCNGFQLWAKSGLLPGLDGLMQQVTLDNNDSGKFENRWVRMKVNPKSPCVWTKGMESLFLPIRHGEGKLIVSDDPEGQKVLRDIKANNLAPLQYADKFGRIALSYPDNPNGSTDSIAALCDSTGRVFALMPHPEAFVHMYTHPFWTRIKSDLQKKGKKLPSEGEGLQIFKNAVSYAKEKLI